MSKLYLVRHGETDWNRENRCQGCIDIELNNYGIEQAKASAEYLSNEKIDIVFSSNLKRAYKSAEYIAEKLNLSVIENSALNEINFGEWEGLTFEEMRHRTDYDYNMWKTQPNKAVIPGEGTLEAISERAMSFVNKIIDENSGKNILVVSHGAILKVIILSLLNISFEAYNKFYITNSSVSVLTLDKERNYINVLNDTCHLKGLVNTKPIF